MNTFTSSFGLFRSGGSLVLVAAATLSCSEASPPAQRSLVQELAGGTIDPDSEAVFALRVVAPDPILCSAVLVAPNLLLTARHCVSSLSDDEVECGAAPLDELVEPGAIIVDNALSFLDSPSETQPTVQRIDVPLNGSDICGFDLAALQLTTNVEVEPLDIRLHQAPFSDEPYRAVGYGTQSTNQGSRAGVRLHLDQQRVSCVANGCSEQLARAGDASVDVAETEFVGSEGVCRGDSGGPAIDTNERVFGIASRSRQTCQTPVYTSLTAFADFLHETLDRAADAGGYEAPPHDHPASVSHPTPSVVKPVPDVAHSGDLGEACSSERSCNESLVCFYSGSVDNAKCVARCSSDTACGNRESCDLELRVCVPRVGTPNDPGCSIPARVPRAASAPLWLFTLGMLARRRRRGRLPRSARRRKPLRATVVAGQSVRQPGAGRRKPPGAVVAAERRHSPQPLAAIALSSAVALLSSVGGCGNDAASSAPQFGVIETSPTSFPGGAGAGGEHPQGSAAAEGAGAGGAGAGGAAADSAQRVSQAIGRACETARDCPDELTCLSHVQTGDAAPSLPGGLCTLPCRDNDTCAEYRARCIDIAGGAYCVEACDYTAKTKCHGREDFACEPTYRKVEVSCDVDRDCAHNAVCRAGVCHLIVPLCLPRCSEGDCPDSSHCDPVSGECLETQPLGDALGSPCDPDADTDVCRGICLPGQDEQQGRCTEFCRLGTTQACGSEAACLLTLGTAGGSTPGDQGACAPLCNCNDDCPVGLSCLLLTESAGDQRGYCALPASEVRSIACSDPGSPAMGGAAGGASN